MTKINPINQRPLNDAVKAMGSLATRVCKDLDTKFLPAVREEAHYRAFLEHSIANPTIGRIAEHQIIEKSIKTFPGCFNRNKSYLDEKPEFKFLRQMLDDRIKTLYPKQYKIREYIISQGRIELGRTKPSKGYGILDKIRLFFS